MYLVHDQTSQVVAVHVPMDLPIFRKLWDSWADMVLAGNLKSQRMLGLLRSTQMASR